VPSKLVINDIPYDARYSLLVTRLSRSSTVVDD